MKVLIDGRVLTHRFITGVQRYTRELLKAFDKIGFSYEVALPRSKNHYLQHLWEHSVLPKKAKSYDLLFCPGNMAPIWKPKNLKLVVTIHDLSFMYFSGYSKFFTIYYKFAIPKIIKTADKIITVSETEKEMILKHFPKYEKKIIAVQNGVDEIFLKQEVTFEKENYILYVGGLNPRKNLHSIMEAFLRVADKIPHKLIIAGTTAPIFKKINKKVSERIIFLDYVEDKNLTELYQKAFLFVFPSFDEGSGLPPAEAMACGCPVLVSDIPALRERCADAAIYCNPYSIEDISEKISTVLENKELRNQLIEKGLNRARRFSWEKTAKETLKVFEEVVKGNAGE